MIFPLLVLFERIERAVHPAGCVLQVGVTAKMRCRYSVEIIFIKEIDIGCFQVCHRYTKELRVAGTIDVDGIPYADGSGAGNEIVEYRCSVRSFYSDVQLLPALSVQ